jgi:formylglycine-generating enzyme required for sulfatase activity
MINKYNANFGTANSLVITTDNRGADKPATSVSWNEAARFVNWLNTSTGNMAAYKFTTSGVNDDIALWQSGDAGYDASNRYRNSLAKYVLPSDNEWYKAAFYDPNKNGGAGGYWKYPTGSDTAPTGVASGTAAGTVVYYAQIVPANVTQAGGLSPYGVMGLGGNAWEFPESSLDLSNGDGSSYRALRGGWWSLSASVHMSSGDRNHIIYPYYEINVMGFRVASVEPSAPVVPEPSMMVIGTLFGLGGLMAKRRMKK